MVKSNSVNKHDYSSTPSVLNLCQEMTDLLLGSMGDSDDKEFVCSFRDQGLIPGSGRSLEKGMITYSNILAWRVPWTEEPGGLQSMGSQRVRHN